MGKKSAGMLMFRRGTSGVEVFLVHPGGPLWARRDSGAWTVPKGEIDPGEEAAAAARREFLEETGRSVEECAAGTEPPFSVGSVVQRGGKIVHEYFTAAE